MQVSNTFCNKQKQILGRGLRKIIVSHPAPDVKVMGTRMKLSVCFVTLVCNKVPILKIYTNVRTQEGEIAVSCLI